MHYKNGREAKEGDHVIYKDWSGKVRTGVLYDLDPQPVTCNARLTVIVPGGVLTGQCVTVGELIHAEDALACEEATRTANGT